MSDATGESTTFSGSGCHGGASRCDNCGAQGYSMRDDGPRCNGCGRLVLKDESASYESITQAGPWGNAAPPSVKPPAYSGNMPAGEMTAESVMAGVMAILQEAKASD